MKQAHGALLGQTVLQKVISYFLVLTGFSLRLQNSPCQSLCIAAPKKISQELSTEFIVQLL